MKDGTQSEHNSPQSDGDCPKEMPVDGKTWQKAILYTNPDYIEAVKNKDLIVLDDPNMEQLIKAMFPAHAKGKRKIKP